MEDAVGFAAQIRLATQVLHDPQSQPAARREANELIMKVPQHQAVARTAALLVGAEEPPATRFFAFQLLAGACMSGRLPAQDIMTVQCRDMLLDMLRLSTLGAGGDLAVVPAFVREKYTQALAAVVVYSSDWPAEWPQLQTALLEASRKSHLHLVIVLTFFRNLAEALQSDAASRLSSQRRKVLQAHLAEFCGSACQSLLGLTVSSFPGRPELDRAGVLLCQELASIVPTKNFLAADLDKFLHPKLSDAVLRGEVIAAYTEWLAKDIAKDLKEAPDRVKQFLSSIFDLAGFCTFQGLSAEDYEVHKAVAMLLRDFADCNRPSFEKHPDLQAKMYQVALQLLRYPSVFIQAEAASIVPQMIKVALPDAKKGRASPAPVTPPSWMQLKAELLPLLLICVHKEITPAFGIYPLPAGFREALTLTSDMDRDDDLPGMQQALRGRAVEIINALTPAPAAILECLEFAHELLPRVLQALPASNGSGFVSFDAALCLLERIAPSVKASAGQQAIQVCGRVITQVLQVPAVSSQVELRRLEFLGRVGAALDLLAESGQENNIIVQVFTHLFGLVEAAGKELRVKALYTSIGVCKAAPKAIRPVLEPIVAKAAGLLSSAADNQHVLCEALVAASTAAQNFEQQQNLLQNLLAPLMDRWSALASLFATPEKLQTGLLGDRAQLDACRQLVLCFWASFRSSTVPSDPAACASGGFVRTPQDANSISTKNPACAVVGHVLPGLVSLLRSLHAAFPSDVTRTGVAVALQPYVFALDVEELKALTSSLDSKGKEEANTWEHAFPPPPGQDPTSVLQGRQLLYSLRSHLYKCLGAALTVQDGTLTNPELPSMLTASMIDSMDSVHPFHLELQLRNVWLSQFSATGMPSAGDSLRASLAGALLPRLLPSAAQSLERYWQWLQLPDGHPAAATGDTALLWAMCTGTVMASRTLVDLVSSLVMHGGPAAKGPPGDNGMAHEEQMGGKRKDRKGKNRSGGTTGGTGESVMMSDAAASGLDAISKPGSGFASVVLTQPEVLEAVQRTLCVIAQWQDPKALDHALTGMRAVAVRLMSAGESNQNLRDVHAAAPEAPQRCAPVLNLVLKPLVALCLAPPRPPPGGGALYTVIGKPFADFFSPEKQQGRVAPSPFATNVTAVLWVIIWGFCQVFTNVCKRAQAKAELQHVANFPALADACQLLATLPRVSEQDVRQLLTAFLDSGTDLKVKRMALRSLVRKAVDPEPAPGEVWT